MKSTFKVLFYLKKGSEKRNGEVIIMARITVDGKICQFSTKQSIRHFEPVHYTFHPGDECFSIYIHDNNRLKMTFDKITLI